MAAIAWVLLCACGAGEPRPPLRVGTSGDYAPFSFDGRGFDVEVAERLAADLHMRVEWVAFRWPQLARDLAADRFDVAMSGVTWRPRRAVVGWMTRAVAAGGPCVIGAVEPARVGVNRGGILERFARGHFESAEIVAVDDNRALPDLLAAGSVDAIVTDSFELRHFLRGSQQSRCERALDRKVYWVAPARAAELGPRIDDWIARHEPYLQELRSRWLGGPMPRDDLDHLADLIARRLALMPEVARYKIAHGRALEDPAREAVVLDSVAARAADGGLEQAGVREAFALQIELAKAIQARVRAAPEAAAQAPLDLAEQLRPALSRLGNRLILALREAAPAGPAARLIERLRGASALLEPAETARLAAAIGAVRRAGAAAGSAPGPGPH